MKKPKLLLCLLFLAFSISFCEGQSWLWGKQGSSNSDVELGCVAVDSKSNVYFAGPFSGSITFGSYTLSASSTYFNNFLVKYDTNGNVIWARQSFSFVNHGGFTSSTTVDDSDNIYCTGFSFGKMIFGSDTIGYDSSEVVFLLKYDTAGNLIWARQSTDNDGFGNGVATDRSGNIFVTGTFADTISFGIIKLIGGGEFLVKYASNGNVLWARQSSKAGVVGSYVATDNFGNAFVTGIGRDSESFGNCHLLNIGIFVVKYDANGNAKWATGSYYNGSVSPSTDCTDKEGNVYITGEYSNPTVFGTDTLTGIQAYLVKYDSLGNLVWAKQSKGSEVGTDWFGYALTKDTHDNLFLTAGLYGGGGPHYPPVKFVFGNDSINVLNAPDPFVIMKFSTSGDPECISILETGGHNKSGVACSKSGKYVYTGSSFFDTATIGTDFLSGTSPPFVTRWQPCNTIGNGVNEITNNPYSITLFPNPNDGIFTLQISGTQNVGIKIEIYNVLGEMVETGHYLSLQNTINISNQPNGVYLYRVLNEDGSLVGEGKVIIQR